MNASPIRCLITAGPTREYFDPVRYITNPSSGKMGYAIAQAAQAKGWTVDLVTGPVSLSAPEGVTLHKVETGQQMLETCKPLFKQCDLLIKTAAVCDFRPADYQPEKVKKTDAALTVTFQPVVDILKTLASGKTHQTVVGFAAETQDIEAYAQRKLREKQLDWIVANQVGRGGKGFESDHNEIVLLGKNGERIAFGEGSKTELAVKLIEELSRRHRATED